MTDSSGRESLPMSDQRSVASTRESYERIPYHTSAWSSAQPVHIEKTAKLYGLEAASPEHCRVLELGCGDGGNLIPLAIAHPGSTFVGVDLAKGHVDAGIALSGRLGLDNLRLVATSFVDFADDGGARGFDYVIVHGLMSWVTPHLQELLFASVERLLAPRGVAFISYNTWPGWHMKYAIRELLREHNRDIDDVDRAVERARALLHVLVQTVPEAEVAYRDHLESIAAVASNPAKRYYFAHEYLEDENHPFYVREFIERAGGHGLQYLADADLIDLELDNMPPEPATLLESLIEDRAHRLQILDFAVNRKFRQSLLCRADVRLRELADLERISEMWIASGLTAGTDDPDWTGDGTVAFGDRTGRTIEVDQPLVKSALQVLSEASPQPLAFAELVERAAGRIGGSAAADGQAERNTLSLILGRLHQAGMVDVQASAPCWAMEPGDRPVATPLTRLRAAAGEPTTSLRHRTVALDNDHVCEVLALLDGTRDRADLVAHFEGRIAEAEIEKILQLAARNAVLMR